ncbi:MAG: YbaB/EbfC family nucleoid-associated protein [Anaerolineae bacterium]|nr:YbaB/EbfC family nucleoid-associated protein [Anaerolineae bacterium]
MARKKQSGFGGPMGGGVPSQASLMRQIKKMQEDMEAAQAALGEETLEVSAGGGAVTIVITGHQVVKTITINPEAIDTADDEWLTDLQDLLVAAVNRAVEESQAYAAERMQSISGSLDSMLPGGLFG